MNRDLAANKGKQFTITGPLIGWTDTARENLPGVRGEILEYNWKYDGNKGAYLVRLEKPVQVNPISTFKECWLHPSEITISDEIADRLLDMQAFTD